MVIDSPVERVLEFIEEPENLAKCAPIVERIEDARRSERRVGRSFRLIYRAFGMTFNEEFTVIGFEPPRRNTPHRRFQLWLTIHGRVKGTLTWTLEAEGNQTYASLDASYQPMGGVFGRGLNALLFERAIKRDVDQMLENMKRLVVR